MTELDRIWRKAGILQSSVHIAFHMIGDINGKWLNREEQFRFSFSMDGQ